MTFKKDMPHTAENVVDIDNNVKSANTKAFKKAINELTGIGDDVYGKRIDEEGMGTFEDILINPNVGSSAFAKLLAEHRILASEAFKILSINSLTEITDYKEAWGKIKLAKEIE